MAKPSLSTTRTEALNLPSNISLLNPLTDTFLLPALYVYEQSTNYQGETTMTTACMDSNQYQVAKQAGQYQFEQRELLKITIESFLAACWVFVLAFVGFTFLGIRDSLSYTAAVPVAVACIVPVWHRIYAGSLTKRLRDGSAIFCL